MKTILHIAASARMAPTGGKKRGSVSKSIAASFIDQWKIKNTEDKFIDRDVGANPPDFISQDWIAAVFTPEESRTEEQKKLLTLSDIMINEIDQADVILMSSPMYNYGMPASLKAWFDQVIRINKTFTFDLARGDNPLEPIMSGKTLVLITSCGEFGFGVGGIREKMNHLGPHIKTASHYLGIESFYEINAEYQEFGDDRHKASVSNAILDAKKLALELSR